MGIIGEAFGRLFGSGQESPRQPNQWQLREQRKQQLIREGYLERDAQAKALTEYPV